MRCPRRTRPTSRGCGRRGCRSCAAPGELPYMTLTIFRFTLIPSPMSAKFGVILPVAKQHRSSIRFFGLLLRRPSDYWTFEKYGVLRILTSTVTNVTICDQINAHNTSPLVNRGHFPLVFDHLSFLRHIWTARRLNFHHICGTTADTSANATAQCQLDLEMSDGHFYQLDASRKFFDFGNDDPDKVSNLTNIPPCNQMTVLYFSRNCL